MPIYISRIEEFDDGIRRQFLHCYWDEGSGRPSTRQEARYQDINGHGHDVQVGEGDNPRDKGWVVSSDALWICPTHAKDLPP